MRKVQEAATSGKDNANQIQKIALYEDSSSEHFITDRMSNSKGMIDTHLKEKEHARSTCANCVFNGKLSHYRYLPP